MHKGTFHASRTPVDLKDKWRHVCKQVARLQQDGGAAAAAAPAAGAAAAVAADGGAADGGAARAVARSHHRDPGAKKARVAWTPEEVADLRRGVEQLGEGRWTRIFERCPSCAPPALPTRAAGAAPVECAG